jgi:hypothetical protein
VWWYRFNEVQWRGLGLIEARTAIHYFDQLCGARLLSFRRLAATLAIFSYGAGIGLVRSYLSDPEFGRSPFGSPENSKLFYEYGMWWGVARTAFILLVIPLALSLTRFLSTLVMWTPPRFTFPAFIGLLYAHVAIYVWWTPVVHAVTEGIGLISMVVAILIKHPELFEHPEMKPKPDDFGNFIGMIVCPYLTCIVQMASASAGDIADKMINGGRIAFAAVFVFSYWARPLIQVPISRIWARIVESKKPVFTMLLGATGTAIALWDLLVHLN